MSFPQLYSSKNPVSVQSIFCNSEVKISLANGEENWHLIKNIVKLNVKQGHNYVLRCQYSNGESVCQPFSRLFAWHRIDLQESLNHSVETGDFYSCELHDILTNPKISTDELVSVIDVLGPILSRVVCELDIELCSETVYAAARNAWLLQPFLFFEFDINEHRAIFFCSNGKELTVLDEFEVQLVHCRNNLNEERKEVLLADLNDARSRKWKFLDDRTMNIMPFKASFLAHESVLGPIIGRHGENLANISRKLKIEIRVFPDSKGMRKLKIIAPKRELIEIARDALEYVYYRFMVSDDATKESIKDCFKFESVKSICVSPSIHSIWIRDKRNEFVFCGLRKQLDKLLKAISKLLADNFNASSNKLFNEPNATIDNRLIRRKPYAEVVTRSH